MFMISFLNCYIVLFKFGFSNLICCSTALPTFIFRKSILTKVLYSKLINHAQTSRKELSNLVGTYLKIHKKTPLTKIKIKIKHRCNIRIISKESKFWTSVYILSELHTMLFFFWQTDPIIYLVSPVAQQIKWEWCSTCKNVNTSKSKFFPYTQITRLFY